MQHKCCNAKKDAQMAGLRASLASLHRLSRLFQRKIGAASRGPSVATASAPSLREITAFGSNPGNLRMFAHVPSRTEARPALVVALHGCTQNALAYAHGTGWCDAADRHGFVVVYPEQQLSNNPKNCFSWFLPADTARGGGEAMSIRQIIEKAVDEFGIDEKRIFVTGLSAGGAMASVMLATYPEIFAGGAIIGGLPYGSADNVQQALDAMFKDQAPSPRALGDRVRAATKHEGPWPRISVWYGTADTIVKPSNAQHILNQWINVQGLPREPSEIDHGARYTRRVWTDRNGIPQLEAFSVAGMAHGVPLTTTGEDACGAVGPFFLDAGVSATSHIVRFWALDGEMGERALAAEAPSRPADRRPSHQAPNASVRSSEPEQDATTAQTIGSDFNPQRVIAAAFKAAGLPPPREGAAGTNVDPAAIIAAALKAAGLSRR
jgi:poly(hydroxyalkanoate) depolymerase family esterase